MCGMSQYNRPQQARARATLERFFEATVELLQTRPFEALSVAGSAAIAAADSGGEI